MTRSSSASNSTTTTTSNHSPYKAIMTSVPKSKRRKKPLTTAMLKRNINTVTTTNATMANESDNEKNHNNNIHNHNHSNHIDVHSNALSDSVVVKTTTTTTTTEVMNDHSIDSINNNSTSTSTSKKKKKKNKNKGKSHDEFWSNTSNTEERQKIREFWLQLREDERRSLVKVEKEAVLRKMKEQQRHSCNCSVCGKKRTAIEDELEVLYDAYYEELEQYANNQQHSRNNPLAGSYPPSETMYEDDYLDTNGHFCQNDDDDDESEDEMYDEEDESEDEMYDEEDDDDDDDDVSQSDRSDIPSDDDDVQYNGHMTRTASFNNSIDHLNFGNSLTVKGGILTVADDLLKNDGKKFLDMMERLAERRIKKEEVNLETEDYYDEEEDEYDEEEEDDEDSLQDTRTEEQRMEEGRRMFQIFAARMFEQRVLAAYREKVAQERQQRLIQELEEEDRLRQERELKKQKEKERRKDKKRQLKKQKEEERLAKEAQRKAEEEKARAERERKLEVERQKREQERQRREEEKRQKEQERIHREEEKRRRLKEEKERAAEKERKRKEREQKERQERQEREERERRERRFKEEKERRERELKEELERRDRKMQEQKEQWEKQEQKKREDEKKSTAGRTVPSGSSASSSTVKRSPGKTPSSSSTATPQHPHPHHPHHLSNNNIMASSSSSSSSNNRLPQPVIGESSRQQQQSALLLEKLNGTYPPSLGLDLLPTQPPQPPLMPSLDFISARDPVPTSSASQLSMGISPLGSQVEVCGTPKAAPRAIAPIGPPANGRRASSAVAGPIGSPVGLTTSRMKSGSDASADRTAIYHAAASASSPASAIATPGRETQYSFFSNFLFGDPPSRAKNPCVVPPLQPEQDNKSVKGRSDTHLDRRFSNDTQEMGWTNGWTASSLLSDDFHGRLFGDVLPDRNTMILERAKISYAKLNEMTQIVGFHTLDQLHRMMNDLYCDCPIGIQELYHVLMVRTPPNPFRCISDPRYGGIIVHHQDEPQLRSVGFDMNVFPTAVSPPTSSGTPGSNNSLGQLPLNSTHPLHCNNGR